VATPSGSVGDSGTGSVELALLSLRARRQDDWTPVFDAMRIEPLPVEEAVRILAAGQLEPIMRLRVLHDLGNLGLLDDMNEEARHLAEGVTDGDRFDEISELASQTSLSFRGFVESLQQQGIATTSMLVVAPEECTDSPAGPGPNAATKIVASFEAAGRPRDFAYGADPLHWPECNSFFLSMTASQKTSLPVDNVDGSAYQAQVLEIVGIKAIWELHTNLDVRYFVTNEAVGMEYSFAGSIDGQIDVDHGFVIVEAHPKTPGRVIVRSQKTVRFVHLSNLPASFACELGWVQVMQNMASCAPSN
jgi:hypothetical protein